MFIMIAFLYPCIVYKIYITLDNKSYFITIHVFILDKTYEIMIA